jgi:citrate lyase subunit beta/citryl-CoA lyase
MSKRPQRLRRSELSTPGTSPKMIGKAAASAADLVFLDLEDAVAPPSKAPARANIVAGLNDLDWGSTIRACRINGVDTEWCHDDIIEIVTGAGANLDVMIVPKVKGPRDVRIGLEVLIEETEALARVEEIAASSERLEALILGVGDLSASQGVRIGHIGGTGSDDGSGYPGDVWHYARNRMIVAARANGLDAVDGPFANIGDPEAYRREARWATTLGSVGKWCIHPTQIAIANEVFAPTDDEIKQATDAVDAVREAEEQGLGAANLNGMMVDAATARVFQAVLDRAEMCRAR